MEIVSLDGQFALKVPLQKEYIQIKRYEPYGEEVEKTEIAAITEDMYVDWEMSEDYNNIEEFISSYREYSKYAFYTDDDVSTYKNLIRWQDDFGKIEPGKTYYDNRIVIDAENKDITSKFIEYDVSNPQQIPQKSKKFPFWIEVHYSKTEDISIHICFRIDINKVSEKCIYFVLDAESKYIFLEANRILIILVQSGILNIQKEETQKEFKNFIDEYRIKKAFGLIAGEYDIWSGEDNTYWIRSVDNNRRVSISLKQYVDNMNNEHIEYRNIFELYKLTFEKCNFKDELIVQNLHDVQVTFRNCAFEKEVRFNNTTFMGEICFKESIFSDIVDFRNSEFLENNSSEKGRVDFYHNSFKKQASFSEAYFGTNAWFLGTVFEAGVDFRNAKFYSICFEAKFQGAVDFQSATFEQQASFSNTTFSDYTSFNDSKFLDDVNFLGVHFEGGVYFTSSSFKQNACFQGVTFHGNANFDQVEFQVGEDSEAKSIADFSGAHFQKTAELNATFGHDAKFKGAIFNDNAEFGEAKFSQKAIFKGAWFEKKSFFSKSTFEEADFSKVNFKKRSFFTKAHFHKMANFSNATFNHNAYFDETNFKGEVSFNHSEFYKNVDFYKTKFKEIPKEAIAQGDIPDFFQTTFNGSIKLVGTKLFNLDFEQLKALIEKKEGKQNE